MNLYRVEITDSERRYWNKIVAVHARNKRHVGQLIKEKYKGRRVVVDCQRLCGPLVLVNLPSGLVPIKAMTILDTARRTLDFLYRVKVWDEGKPDLHDAKEAVKAMIPELEKQVEMIAKGKAHLPEDEHGDRLGYVRHEFEGWYAPLFAGGSTANMPVRSNGEYVSAQQQVAWMAWQTSRLVTLDKISQLENDNTALATEKGIHQRSCEALVICNKDLNEQLATLETQVAALTQERDEYSNELKHGALPSLLQLQDQLAAAQAVNEKLREALAKVKRDVECVIKGHYLNLCVVERELDTALVTPSDTTALQQRLAEERERCAKYLEDHPTMLLNHLVAAIRSME